MGDKITWTSGKAAPHNILFDEENVPGGVDAKALGQPDGEYLNEEGDTFSQTFSVAGLWVLLWSSCWCRHGRGHHCRVRAESCAAIMDHACNRFGVLMLNMFWMTHVGCCAGIV